MPNSSATAKKPTTLPKLTARSKGAKVPPESAPITKLKKIKVKRSLMMQLATTTRAMRVSVNPKSLKLFRVITTAVAVPMISPTKTEAARSNPKNWATAKLTAKGTAAPAIATPSERLSAAKNSLGWVSTPAWNIRKKMPISANNWMASSGSIQPNTAGPTKTPTINSPITVGRPSGRKVTATSQIPASKMSKSSATLCMSGVPEH